MIAISKCRTLLVVGIALIPAVAFAATPVAPSTSLGDLERAAFQAASDAVPAPDHFEPATFRFGGEAPPADSEFELLDIDGPNQSGVVRMTFAVLSTEMPGKTTGEVWTSVRGTVHGPALVATRSVARGDAIVTGDIELTETDLTRLRHPPLRDPGQLDGQVPVRTLGAGRVITEDLLEPMPAVYRNQAVRVQFVRRGLTLTTTGTALADGAPGETITAVNTSTGARMLCEVQTDGSLHVIRGLGGGRRR